MFNCGDKGLSADIERRDSLGAGGVSGGRGNERIFDLFVKPPVIQQEHCLHCGNCMEACPFDAVEKR